MYKSLDGRLDLEIFIEKNIDEGGIPYHNVA
jgi:hypothetical protein